MLYLVQYDVSCNHMPQGPAKKLLPVDISNAYVVDLGISVLFSGHVAI
jgi:hypothetical protein